MMQNPYVRVQNIFNANNFDKSLREAAKFIEKHTGEYNTMPTIEQVNAATNSKLKAVKEVSDGHYEWFLDEFEKFTRRQELERAILKSADLLEKGTYEPVEKIIKDAVQISLTKDLGIEYWDDPEQDLWS